tara:strand:- start:195 stop:626 length:432 start_codon:yes stop_codon:yes gene_type:complete
MIVQNKIPLYKWLQNKNIYLDINNKEILFNIYNELIKIVDKYNDICIENSYNLFDEFCLFMYNEYVYPNKISCLTNIDDSEYIEAFCEQDIIDVFLKYKNNYDIFKYNSNSYPLLLFIVNNSIVLEINDNYLSDSDSDSLHLY